MNLSPGQILPRSHDYGHRSLIPPHPLCQPPQTYSDDSRTNHTPYHQHPQMQSFTQQEPPGHPQQSDFNDSSGAHSQHSVNLQHRPMDGTPIQAPQHLNAIGAFTDSGHLGDSRSLQHSRNDDPRHFSDRPIPEADRRDRRQDHRSTSSSDPVHALQWDSDRQHLQVPQGFHHAVSFDTPTHTQLPHPSEQGRRSLDSLHPSWHSDAHRQRPDRDRRSLQVPKGNGSGSGSSSDLPSTSTSTHSQSVQSHAPSIQTSAGSHSSTRSRSDAPQPRHLPKRLVMPTPLQSQQHPSHPGGPSASARPNAYSSRDKGSLQPRAQAIPMLPESRKLVRKRTSALNQQHVALTSDTEVVDASSRVIGQREMPKRVLSKRRNDI